MLRSAHAALGTEPAMTEAALGALGSGGTSVDACIAGLFAAAGAKPAVLLGSMVILVAGTGVGSPSGVSRGRPASSNKRSPEAAFISMQLPPISCADLCMQIDTPIVHPY